MILFWYSKYSPHKEFRCRLKTINRFQCVDLYLLVSFSSNHKIEIALGCVIKYQNFIASFIIALILFDIGNFNFTF